MPRTFATFQSHDDLQPFWLAQDRPELHRLTVTIAKKTDRRQSRRQPNLLVVG
jgi:hypothetical protein